MRLDLHAHKIRKFSLDYVAISGMIAVDLGFWFVHVIWWTP